jgi:hypothetical protein
MLSGKTTDFIFVGKLTLHATLKSHPCAQNAQGWGTRLGRDVEWEDDRLYLRGRTHAARDFEIPPLRRKRARMGHPAALKPQRDHYADGRPEVRAAAVSAVLARLVRVAGRELDLGQEELFCQRQPLLVGDLGGEILEGGSTVLGQGAERHRRHAALQAGCGLLGPPAG